LKTKFLNSIAKRILILSSLIPYLYMTQWAGLASIMLVGITATTFNILGIRKLPYRSESLVVLIALILLLRCVFNQNQIRNILLGLLIGMMVFLLMNRRYIVSSVNTICDSKVLVDCCVAALSLSAPLAFYASKFPNSQFTWMLIGDGNNWFTQLRLIQSISGHRFRELIANSPGTSVLTDLLNPVRAKSPSLAFISDLNAMLNFQLIIAIFIVALFMHRIHKSRNIPFSMRVLLVLLLTQFGSILGMAGLNGFISSSVTLFFFLLLLSFSEINFSNNRIYEFLLYSSMVIIFLFTWSLLIPFVIAQYLFVRVPRNAFNEYRFAFLMTGALLTFLSLNLGVRVVEQIDVVGYLTIPRGGMWPDLNVNIYLGFLILLFVIMHQNGIFSGLYSLQLWVLVVTCQLLFLGYENPRFWSPWSSYYPQKLFTLVYLAFSLWIIAKLLAHKRDILISVALIFSLALNFYLQLPNPILDKTTRNINTNLNSKLDLQGPNALSFILTKIDEKKPFAFWNFYDWPVESSVNAWAGLAWEQYPGNWSLPKDDLLFNTNYSGPVGNRNYHDGNQTDIKNLCRLASLLPSGSVIFTRDIIQTKVSLRSCELQAPIALRSK
jgi:hypothetical protein